MSLRIKGNFSDFEEFQEFLKEFREKETIDWSEYKDRLQSLSSRFSAHFAQFDDTFASLSRDIVHDVVGAVAHTSQIEKLVELEGTWGDTADTRCENLAAFKQNTVVYWWHEKRWRKLVEKAPKLAGKLKLNSLCKWIEKEQFYEELRPTFTEINLTYHIYEKSCSLDELKPLRDFLVSQLKSSCLRKLGLRINGDLRLEEELLAFCASQRCRSLNWDCHPLSVDFFVQVYNSFKKKRSVAIEPSKKITGFIDQGALMALVQALKLKRKNHSSYHGDTRVLSGKEKIKVEANRRKGTSRVDVSIRLGAITTPAASNKSEISGNQPAESDEKENLDGSDDCGDEPKYWDAACYCNKEEDDCELHKLSEETWIRSDCDDCDGCQYCKSHSCNECGYTARCRMIAVVIITIES